MQFRVNYSLCAIVHSDLQFVGSTMIVSFSQSGKAEYDILSNVWLIFSEWSGRSEIEDAIVWRTGQRSERQNGFKAFSEKLKATCGIGRT